MKESDDLRWLRPDGKTQVIYDADNEQDEARRRCEHKRFSSPHSLSQWTGTFPRYDYQRRVAPDDREDVREARHHNHSARTTQMVDGKHKKSNKVKNITTARV